MCAPHENPTCLADIPFNLRYLLVPGFLDLLDTEALLTRSKQLLDNFSLEDHPLVRCVVVMSELHLRDLNHPYADEVHNQR